MIAPLVSAKNALLFGSQALAFNEEAFRQLRTALLDSPKHSWISETLADLPSHWHSITQSIPRLQSFPGNTYLQGLEDWLRSGEAPAQSFPLPNILLTPLVVVIHLIQYANFLEINQRSFKHGDEIVGLCTGLLSAQVAASSKNQDEFVKYGGVAIRLAMLVGACVDAQDAELDAQGESISLSVAWITPQSGAELARILKFFPEVSRTAYIVSPWPSQ